jgi:hypothetical protein
MRRRMTEEGRWLDDANVVSEAQVVDLDLWIYNPIKRCSK